MMKFYTCKGDDGTTGLLGDGRVKKNDLRMETLGTLDELSAFLGLARSLGKNAFNGFIKNIQIRIYEIMSELAATKENQLTYRKITESSIEEVENKITEFSSELKSINGFILPGDSQLSASLSIARTVCRRCERRVVELFDEGVFSNENIKKYLNRLSSLLYVMEVFEASKSQGTPTPAKVKE
jgi:cob(I)alamin adenosyltransferase